MCLDWLSQGDCVCVHSLPPPHIWPPWAIFTLPPADFCPARGGAEPPCLVCPAGSPQDVPETLSPPTSPPSSHPWVRTQASRAARGGAAALGPCQGPGMRVGDGEVTGPTGSSSFLLRLSLPGCPLGQGVDGMNPKASEYLGGAQASQEGLTPAGHPDTLA